MKKIYPLLSGLMAIAIVITFTQCTGGKKEAAADAGVPAKAGNYSIAFVNVDTLLTQYELWKNLNNEMMRKEENIKATLNEKARDLRADYDDFQRKLQNNAYATQSRAEEEQNRIMKKKNELDQLQDRLTSDLMLERQKNDSIVRDSIKFFIEEYNKTKKYDLIISRVGDNLLFANEALNITKEVVDGLNVRYKATVKK